MTVDTFTFKRLFFSIQDKILDILQPVQFRDNPPDILLVKIQGDIQTILGRDLLDKQIPIPFRQTDILFKRRDIPGLKTQDDQLLLNGFFKVRRQNALAGCIDMSFIHAPHTVRELFNSLLVGHLIGEDVERIILCRVNGLPAVAASGDQDHISAGAGLHDLINFSLP